MIENYNIDNLLNKIKSENSPVVLFGAGVVGKMALFAFKKFGVRVHFFYDSDEKKQGNLFCGIKTISQAELSEMSSKAYVFISCSYITAVSSILEQMQFTNIYNCVQLFENTDFSEAILDLKPWDALYHEDPFDWNVKRNIALHKMSCLKNEDNIVSKELKMKHIDIVVTERCSLKCIDCSNLMQYYAAPKHCDLDLLFKSVDKLMECIDQLSEFRVIGGDPFMHKELFKVINKLLTYKNADSLVIYTNAKIIPKGENLSCLQHEKVILQITNYGEASSKHDELIEVLNANNITYVTNRVTRWNDCGRIQKHQQRSNSELSEMFMNCCARDVLTLLHGKLYRCPFSAHSTNLNAIPINGDEVVDLSEENSDIFKLKTEIRNFYNDIKYISACNYCNGRDYGSAEIDAALQTKNPLPLEVY